MGPSVRSAGESFQRFPLEGKSQVALFESEPGHQGLLGFRVIFLPGIRAGGRGWEEQKGLSLACQQGRKKFSENPNLYS
jgi:hypothetical protein